MTCSTSSQISFEFQKNSGETYLEIRPRSMQFDRTRGKFDYCQAEFSQEVADHLKPHFEDEDSFLYNPLPVILKIEGEPIYRLLWVPDGVRFANDNIHIEFHDPQKYLTEGVVDWRKENVKLKEAYTHVFEQRKTDGPDIFNDIIFTAPDKAYEELDAFRSGFFDFDNLLDFKTQDRISEQRDDALFNIMSNDVALKKIEEENVVNIIEGHYAVDFDKMTPWECILELNEKFGVNTWSAPDGNLYVGTRSSTGNRHIAAADDSRVWKLNDYNMPTTRNPVTRSVVRGGWVDNPKYSKDPFEDTEEINSLNKGTQEFRIESVASVDMDSFLGLEIFEENINAKRDSLEEIAKRKMTKKQREQQSGHIEILPEFSGDDVSDVKYVSIGDSILTVPPDSDSGSDSVCNTNIEKEMFDIVGVKHELLESGNWNIRLHVVKQLDGNLSPDNIETNLRYYDPSSERYIEGDEYSEFASHETDGFWDNLFS